MLLTNNKNMATLRHVGIVVNDIDKSLRFWQCVFKLNIINKSEEKGEYLEKILKLKDVELTSYKLKGLDQLVIEILKFKTHKENNHNISQPYHQGFTHIAFNVVKIEEMLERYKKEGFDYSFDIVQAPNNGPRVAYTQGPEGILIELVEA